jgi:hypothetical protein
MGYHTYESYAVRGPPSVKINFSYDGALLFPSLLQLLFLFSPKVKITCLQDAKGRRYLVLKNKKVIVLSP